MAKYVAYMIAPSHRNGALFFATDALNNQEKHIQDFLQLQEGELIATFVEVGGSQRHRHRWPQLQNAVKHCKNHHAHLLIAEIRNLTHNESFANIISGFLTSTNSHPFEIHCLDQPFITRETFGAIVKHANEQRKYHGKLIKEGLHRAHAHPGNPRAFEVISKVNKPKIDNAITFSLLMMPVIHDYQQKGFSQRKIVQLLNEEGYHAPEGGNWVLSQLQKVLDRMKF
ncbi:MAG TPA: hypothetical protein VFP93_02120, partial [Gammaproteobacteria bacterium]|nr:hypothetical protein [Gammaproteobacteria bacterium]